MATARSPGPPLCGGRLGFYVLDIGGEYPNLEVCGAGGQEHVVWVPVHGGDCASDGPLDVLGHPPVVVLLKVADGYNPGARAHGKLVFPGGPAHTGGRPEGYGDVAFDQVDV